MRATVWKLSMRICGVRNGAADCLLGERDQLQHLERIEQARGEQRRVRIDANAPGRDLVVEPREHLAYEFLSPRAHAAAFSTVCPQLPAMRARSIGFQ